MAESKTRFSINTRHAQIRELIKKDICTHILISDTVDAEYITGFHSSNVYLLIGKKRSYLATDFRYHQVATEFCARNTDWTLVETGDVPFSFLRGKVKPGACLGIQSAHLTLDQYERLKKQCPGVRFVKLNDYLPSILTPKLPHEIDSMRRAARIGDMALDRLQEQLKTGITERQAAALLESYCRQLGSERPSFDTIVLFGERAALPHGVPGNQRLKSGHFVLIDFGCVVDGFCSDMTRTFVFGKASSKQRSIYESVLRANEKAKSVARAGIRTSAIDSAARELIETAGFGKQFQHATGHGVGRRVHERPRIGQSDKTVLQQNTVFTIEPGIYLSDLGGVRIEDMVVALPDGIEVLTHFPRELTEIIS